MTNSTEAANTAGAFYGALESGDSAKAASLLSRDATWVTVQAFDNATDGELKRLAEFITRSVSERYNSGWSFTVNGRGPKEILEYVLEPLREQGAQYIPSSTEFKEEDDRIISVGNYKNGGVRAAENGKSSYAHVLTVKDGKISQLYQFFYTLSIPVGTLQ